MAASAKHTPKSAALLASSYEFSASIEELEKKANEDKPSDNTKESYNETSTRAVGNNSSSNPLEPESELASGPNSDPERSRTMKRVVPKSEQDKNEVKKLDWSKLLDYTRKNHIALYCVLSNCGHKIDDEGLTIYANNKFYKKKLDDTKYSVLLSKCLQEIGFYKLDIHTIPTPLAPQDSQAAAVAVIMGGGEEVSIESI
jgi:hypothetical protein